MRIMITGSNGFIGRHTMNLLEVGGHETFGFDHKNRISHDILYLDKLLFAMQKFNPDAVLHLAASSSLRKAIDDPVYDARNNIIGTINVLDVMKEVGCRRIVFASTSAV